MADYVGQRLGNYELLELLGQGVCWLLGISVLKMRINDSSNLFFIKGNLRQRFYFNGRFEDEHDFSLLRGERRS